jgi:hypothetical protein
VRSGKSYSDVKRNNASAAKEMKKEVSRTADYLRENQNSHSNREMTSNNSGQKNKEKRVRGDNGTNYEPINKKNNQNKEIASTEMSRRSTGYSTENSRNNDKTSYKPSRSAVNSNSERYNLNSEDSRYKPNREYKGSNKYWSSDFRTENKNSNHSHGNQNYNNYKHWDRNWEGYRWNHDSWRNYYGYYNPYSYRNHKYYYHHNYYGHVIRRFVNRPQIYVHNHVRYYCYDGYFFRYRSGVGYVLVDIPFGMTFEYLPGDYERVYINGYLYFRVGNLFFENTNYGFQLVHYPERYFAYNDSYRSEGFRFIDMNY